MNYLNEDQELILDSIREFCEREIDPRIETDLEKEVFPIDVLEKMRDAGYTTCCMDPKWGGMGQTMVMQVAMKTEVAKHNFTMALAGCSNTVAKIISKVGTPEQQELFMQKLIDGQAVFGFTEPTAGSDASAIQTVAVKDGDEWVINGQKTFVSFLGVFDYTLVSARTNETGEGGISAFLVPNNTPGVKIGSIFHKMGLHGSNTGELFLEDVRVPAINLIGEENHGMRPVLGVLDDARIGTACVGVGISMAAYEKALAFAKERVVFGKPLIKHQGISWYFAEMATRIKAAEALLYSVAIDVDEGRNYTVGAAQAKLFAGQVVRYVTDLAVQICGGYGLTEDYGVSRLYRDARSIPIVEGTDEILKTVIARSLK